MYVVCVLNHECMHKKIRYKDKKRNTPEKCDPKEAGLFCEKKIFGVEFSNFKDILEVFPGLADFMYNQKNWKPGFVKDYFEKD